MNDLVSRESLLNNIWEFIEEHRYDGRVSWDGDNWLLTSDDVKEIIRKTDIEINTNKSEWILVSERLPEKSNDYQVTKVCKNEDNIIYETCNEIFWTIDKKWDCERDDLCEWKVIAWKFKDEPYRI